MTSPLTCPQTGAPCVAVVPLERHLKEVFGERFASLEKAALLAAAEAAREEVREQAERFALKSDVKELEKFAATSRGRSSAAVVVSVFGLILALIAFAVQVALALR